MKTQRDNSFGRKKLSFFDMIIQNMRIKKIQKIINFDDKIIIDTGCGFNANFLCLIKEKFTTKKLIAVDLLLNKDLTCKGIEIVENDLNKEISLEDGYADVVISMAILEHLDSPEIYLNSIFRILKKDGVLLMTVPSVYSKPVLEFLAFKLRLISREEIIDHKKYYNKLSLNNILEKTGFKKDNIKHTYFQLFMNNIVIAKKND